MVIGKELATKIGIYCIENTINNKKYIGSSKNVFKRKNRHFGDLRNNIHPNKKLQASYNKYGVENFKFYVLEFLEYESELINREQHYIDYLKPNFNINLIANSSLGLKRSIETIEKIRQANLGLKHPEWRNKIKSKAQGGENHWTKSKKFDEKSKLKMSNSHKKLFREGYVHPRKGVKESADVIEAKRKRASKPVIQLYLDDSFCKEWSSLKEASEAGYTSNYITKCCRGLIDTYKKFKWKYKEDYEYKTKN